MNEGIYNWIIIAFACVGLIIGSYGAIFVYCINPRNSIGEINNDFSI